MTEQYLRIEKENSILKKIYTNKSFYQFIWFVPSLIMVIKNLLSGKFPNNYLIFKYHFIHLIHQQNLYLFYPEYKDINHYGPIFSLIIAPFALLPNIIGVVLWVAFNLWVLYKAVQMLPIKEFAKWLVLLICAHELITASASVQSNPLVAALIILSYCFVKKEKDFWAAFMIVLGVYFKLYGIVGLAFFLFSKNKLNFILSLIFWSLVLFVAPMIISSPKYIVQTYLDWYQDIIHKNSDNEISVMQNISVMGMVYKIFHTEVSNLLIIVPAIVVYGISLLRFKLYKYVSFQLLLLASTLIFTVIFSTGSESPTYIIAFLGVAIWFINLNKPIRKLNVFLLVFAIVLTSLSPSDLFPKYIKINYVVPYGLKALPCFLIWIKIMFEMIFLKEEAFYPKEDKLKPTLA